MDRILRESPPPTRAPMDANNPALKGKKESASLGKEIDNLSSLTSTMLNSEAL